MAKQQPIESVLHDWVMNLPFTQQALLVMATRGPDGMPKHTIGKSLIHFLRGAVLKPAYPDFNGTCDGYMRTDYKYYFKDIVDEFFKDMDSYPMHFLMHLIHAAEVIGYKHPDDAVRKLWNHFYLEACINFHMNPETVDQLDNRLKL